MAYKGRPLDRVVVAENARLAYIADLSAHSSEDTAPDGVGFPREYVFRFDETLFDSLSHAWNAQNASALDELWARAVPI